MSTIDRIRATISSTARHTSKSMHERTVPVTAWDAEALCDLADAARRLPDDGAVHEMIRAHEGLACGRCMVLWPCPTSAIRDALARLDGDAEGG